MRSDYSPRISHPVPNSGRYLPNRFLPTADYPVILSHILRCCSYLRYPAVLPVISDILPPSPLSSCSVRYPSVLSVILMSIILLSCPLSCSPIHYPALSPGSPCITGPTWPLLSAPRVNDGHLTANDRLSQLRHCWELTSEAQPRLTRRSTVTYQSRPVWLRCQLVGMLLAGGHLAAFISAAFPYICFTEKDTNAGGR